MFTVQFMLLSLFDITTIVFKVFQKELNSIVCAYYTLDNNGHLFACQSVGRGRAEIHALMPLYHCWLKMQCVVWKVCKHKIVSGKDKSHEEEEGLQHEQQWYIFTCIYASRKCFVHSSTHVKH